MDDWKEIAKKTKYTLLTNLNFAQLQGKLMRMQCSAVLISEKTMGFGEPGYDVRGFGPDAAWPVFTYWLKPESFPFEILPAQSNSMLILGEVDAPPKPIFTGNLLKFKDGPEFFLQAENQELPIDKFENVGDIERVWGELKQKAQRYWIAPYMPFLSWGPPFSRGIRAIDLINKSTQER